MEVSVVKTENVPEGFLLSLSAGGSRRQAPLVPRQKFAFSGASAQAAVAFGGSGLKVDVLSLHGSTCVGAQELLPGLQKAFAAMGSDGGAASKAHSVEVEFKPRFSEEGFEVPSMKVSFSIRPAQPFKDAALEPSKEQEAFDTASMLKRSALLPAVEDSLQAALPAKQVGSGQRSRRHQTTLQARSYLEAHRILPFVERLLRSLVQDRPEDPWGHIVSLLPTSEDTSQKGASLSTDPKEVPEERKEPVEWVLLPSVGTWYSVRRPQLPREPEKEAEASEVVNHEVTLLDPWPIQAVEKLVVTAPKDGPGSSLSLTPTTIVEFVLGGLDFELFSAAPELCAVLLEEVKQVVSNRLGVRSVRVEMGSASPAGVAISAAIVQTSMSLAKVVMRAVEEDSKDFLCEVETQLMASPGIAKALTGGGGIGAGNLRASVRQQLGASFEDSAQQQRLVTASTMAPNSAMATMNMTGTEEDMSFGSFMKTDAEFELTTLKPALETDEATEEQAEEAMLVSALEPEETLVRPLCVEEFGTSLEDEEFLAARFVDDFVPAAALERNFQVLSTGTSPMVSARARTEVESVAAAVVEQAEPGETAIAAAAILAAGEDAGFIPKLLLDPYASDAGLGTSPMMSAASGNRRPIRPIPEEEGQDADFIPKLLLDPYASDAGLGTSPMMSAASGQRRPIRPIPEEKGQEDVSAAKEAAINRALDSAFALEADCASFIAESAEGASDIQVQSLMLREVKFLRAQVAAAGVRPGSASASSEMASARSVGASSDNEVADFIATSLLKSVGETSFPPETLEDLASEAWQQSEDLAGEAAEATAQVLSGAIFEHKEEDEEDGLHKQSPPEEQIWANAEKEEWATEEARELAAEMAAEEALMAGEAKGPAPSPTMVTLVSESEEAGGSLSFLDVSLPPHHAKAALSAVTEGMQTKVSHFSVDLDHAAYVPFPKETTASDAAWTTSMDSAGTDSLAGVDAEALQFVSKNLDTLLKAEVPSSNAEEEEHELRKQIVSLADKVIEAGSIVTADMESSVGATPEKVDAHFSVCGSPTPPEASMVSGENLDEESQAVLREVATEAAAAALQLDVLGQVEADSDNLRKISHTTYKASEIAATESMFPGSEAGELAPFDITKTEVATEFLQGSETPGGVALFDFKIPEGSDAFGITKTEVATEFLQGSETPGEVALFDLKIPEGSDASCCRSASKILESEADCVVNAAKTEEPSEVASAIVAGAVAQAASHEAAANSEEPKQEQIWANAEKEEWATEEARELTVEEAAEEAAMAEEAKALEEATDLVTVSKTCEELYSAAEATVLEVASETASELAAADAAVLEQAKTEELPVAASDEPKQEQIWANAEKEEWATEEARELAAEMAAEEAAMVEEAKATWETVVAETVEEVPSRPSTASAPAAEEPAAVPEKEAEEVKPVAVEAAAPPVPAEKPAAVPEAAEEVKATPEPPTVVDEVEQLQVLEARCNKALSSNQELRDENASLRAELERLMAAMQTPPGTTR